MGERGQVQLRPSVTMPIRGTGERDGHQLETFWGVAPRQPLQRREQLEVRASPLHLSELFAAERRTRYRTPDVVGGKRRS